MKHDRIGVFDSGLGGLTAVKEIMRILPEENIIYFGDTGRVPYGTRGEETIVKYVRGDIRFLESFDVKLIVVACGTASSVGIPAVEKETKTPIIGVVDSAARAAVRETKSGRIGVIGTTGTIRSGAYEREIKRHLSDAVIFSKDCPLFVPLVENGHFDTQVARLVAEEYLDEIRQKDVDTLILGCTHYPLLKQVIGEVMGKEVTLIDPGAETALSLKEQMNLGNIPKGTREREQYKYYVSDSVENFTNLAQIFMEGNVNGQVEKIDIEQYECYHHNKKQTTD
jgi:glutamate racemase